MKQTLLSERDSYTFDDKGKRASFVFLSKGDLTTSKGMIKRENKVCFWEAQQYDFIDQKHSNMSIMNIYTAAFFNVSF